MISKRLMISLCHWGTHWRHWNQFSLIGFISYTGSCYTIITWIKLPWLWVYLHLMCREFITTSLVPHLQMHITQMEIYISVWRIGGYIEPFVFNFAIENIELINQNVFANLRSFCIKELHGRWAVTELLV